MKNFKKLIKEAHLGNPLNEEDRFARVDRILAKGEEYDDENLKGSKRYDDVRADLEREEIEENEKFDKIAKMEYGKPWMELRDSQKQELLSYMNRETEKEFERKKAQSDYERRSRGDYSDDMEDGMTDFERSRRKTSDYMNEELKLGVKYELPTGETGYIMTGGSKDPKDWKFSANKEPYLSVKDKLKPTEKQPGKYDGVDFMDENINDPVLMKARAAQMKRDAIEKKDLENKSKRISADKAIDLRYELSILDREREDILMRIEDIGVEMDQTAEPEGGEKADELGGRLMAAERELRDINSKIIDIKDDLGVFDMNESVNEAIDRATTIYQIATPAPQSILVGELKELFPNKEIVTEVGDADGYESVLMFDLSGRDLKTIKDNVGTVLVWKYPIGKAETVIDGPGKIRESDLDEGTCGYTPDGEPRSKPAGPDLEEDDGGAKPDFTLNINDPGNDSRALDDEVDRMFESESLRESLRKSLKKRLS